jgi:hypothetical protein
VVTDIDRIVKVAHGLGWLVLVSLVGLLLGVLPLALTLVGIVVIVRTLRRLLQARTLPALPMIGPFVTVPTSSRQRWSQACRCCSC